MKKLLLSLLIIWIVLFITLCFAKPVSAAEKHVYLPVVISYMNGDILNLALAGTPEDTIKECIDKLQHLIGAAQQNGQVPSGGSVIGACVPAPERFP